MVKLAYCRLLSLTPGCHAQVDLTVGDARLEEGRKGVTGGENMFEGFQSGTRHYFKDKKRGSI